MDKSRIEQIVQQKLQGHQEHIDKDELWADLGLESAPKRRRIVWWMWISAAVGLGVIAYVGTEILSSQPAPMSETSHASDGQAPGSNSDIQSSKGESFDTSTIPVHNNQSDKVEQPTTATTASTVPQSPSSKAKLGHEQQHQSDITSAMTKARHNHIGEQSDLGQGGQSLIESATGISQPSTALTPLVNEIQASKEIDVQLLASRYAQVEGEPRKLAVSEVQVPVMVTPTRSSGEWAAFAEYGSVSRSISPSLQSAEHVALRNESEAVTDVFAVGLQYRHRISRNWKVYAGLRYTQINEVMMYAERDSQAVQRETFEVFTDINGVTTTTPTTGTGYDILEKQWTYQNQMKVVSIPIGLIYEQRYGRWGVDMQAGVALKLASRFSGEILSDAGVVTSNPSYLNTGLGYELSGGLFGKYYLSEQSYLALGPNYRLYATSFTSEVSGMQQTYSTVGGRLSFVTRF